MKEVSERDRAYFADLHTLDAVIDLERQKIAEFLPKIRNALRNIEEQIALGSTTTTVNTVNGGLNPPDFGD